MESLWPKSKEEKLEIRKLELMTMKAEKCIARWNQCSLLSRHFRAAKSGQFWSDLKDYFFFSGSAKFTAF